ncbi:MAG: hypothetical protein R3281_04280 [Balneolaceae bacterium]|nr:hypothetical protein [Balneolaceae bacterium]
MSRSYATESEQIAQFEYYSHELETLLAGEDNWQNVADDLPVMVHTNDRDTLALKFVNEETSRIMDRPAEVIMEQSFELFQAVFHPSSLEFAFEVVQPRCRSLGSAEIFTYTEYYKFFHNTRFQPHIKFVTSCSSDPDSVMVVTVPPDKLGITCRQLEKTIDIDIFRLNHFR